MGAAHQFAQVQRHIGDLVAEQPAQAQEGRGIADDPLRLADRPIPVVPRGRGRHLWTGMLSTGRRRWSPTVLLLLLSLESESLQRRRNLGALESLNLSGNPSSQLLHNP